MSLSCRFLGRDFVPLLEGGLRPARARRLERHLAGCRDCRALFERVRAGHEAGRRFDRLGPSSPGRYPAFEELWAARPVRRGPWPAVAVPVLLTAAAGLFVILAVLGGGPFRSRGDFTPLAIREFVRDSHSRVVTEGYVHNVYYDEEERTLHIKLAEGPREPEPFVICEIRDVRGVTIPREGSRVRVYGQARFDAQPGRGWHEVNPVLEIAVLNR
jgi:hypothetical protein